MDDSHRKTIPSPTFTPSTLINSSSPISLANIPGVFPFKSPISLSAPCSNNHSPTLRCPFAVATNSVDSDAFWNRRFLEFEDIEAAFLRRGPNGAGLGHLHAVGWEEGRVLQQ